MRWDFLDVYVPGLFFYLSEYNNDISRKIYKTTKKRYRHAVRFDVVTYARSLTTTRRPWDDIRTFLGVEKQHSKSQMHAYTYTP